MTLYFYSETGPLGELSNFYFLKTPIIYNDKPWATSEHLYQAAKYWYPEAPVACAEYAEQIRQASTPYKAKMLANCTRTDRFPWQKQLNTIIDTYERLGVCSNPRWNEISLDVMKNILLLKFDTDVHCRSVLLSTRGNNLVEHTSQFLG